MAVLFALGVLQGRECDLELDLGLVRVQCRKLRHVWIARTGRSGAGGGERGRVCSLPLCPQLGIETDALLDEILLLLREQLDPSLDEFFERYVLRVASPDEAARGYGPDGEG